ncbi:MAG: extracellular solute-binding protein [Lachnospiraceae bacterium]|nr:extracellular solute-binding protein [Lachnospiraceae bacterium]MBR4604615.1 extracellular solute-binding protein [Lachnospiraceae bacterium]
MRIKKNLMSIIFAFVICMLGGCVHGKEDAASLPLSEKNEILTMDSYHCVQSSKWEHKLDGWDFPEILCGRQAILFENDLTGGETGQPASVIRMRHGEGVKALSIQAAEDEKICAAGAVVESGDFLTLSFKKTGDGSGREYMLTRRDGEGNVKSSVLLQGADEYFSLFYPEYVIMDAQGNVHLADGLARSTYERACYCVYSSAGELRSSKVFSKNEFVCLMVLSDGRIACDLRRDDLAQAKDRAVFVMDEKTQDLQMVFEYGRHGGTGSAGDGNIWMINCFDGETLVYANAQGIFLCDHQMQNVRRIFGWKENGFEMNEMPEEYYRGISVDDDGIIHVFYDDGTVHFMSFQPFDGEVRELELACASSHPYREAVLEFNKTHPGVHLVISEDYDATALLTKMTAGDGPVLVEPRLLKDVDPDAIWEPLAPLFEKSGLLQELNIGALSLGSRNGTLYYAVPGFSVMTLVTSEEETDWTYDEFLDHLESGSFSKALESPLLWEKPYVSLLFCNGENDSYFWDGETGQTQFSLPKFQRFLELMKRCGLETGGHGQRETGELIEELKTGKTLCHEVTFSGPKDVALFHEIYGSDVNVIGYPHADGARNTLTLFVGELAIRKSASDEDKKAAEEFLETLFSYEVQSNNASKGQSGFSARKDVLEEQIMAVSKGDTSSLLIPGHAEGTRYIQESVDVDWLRDEVNHLIEDAEPARQSDALTDILNEEFGTYYDGGITTEQLTEHLDKRISLYLKER